MLCSACGASIADQSKFCGECGAKQVKPSPTQSTRHESKRGFPVIKALNGNHPALKTIFITTHGFAESLAQLLSEVDGYTSNVISTPSDSHEELAQMCKVRLKGAENVCIVGGFDDINPFQVPNPSASPDDPDEWCFTDGLFACPDFDHDTDDAESAIPVAGVSRIPTLNKDTIRELLGTVTLEGNLRDQFCFGVTAQLWEPATAQIFLETSLNTMTLYAAPDWDEPSISGEINRSPASNKARVFLFNVHGSDETTEWVGDGEDYRFAPTVLSPSALKDMSESVLISEACYGGAMQYAEPSIVEKFFESKGKAFVGCSVVAYGNPGIEDMPLFSADVIALSLLRKLGEGLTLGESLRLAKQETLQEASNICDVDDDLDIEMYGGYAAKAILSFNAFGCPWIKFSDSVDGAAPQGEAQPSRPSASDRLSQLRTRVSARMQSRSQRLTQRLSPLRNSYRAKLPLKSQLFLMSVDESLSAFRSFRDAERIEGLFKTNQIKLSNCKFYKSKSKSTGGYLISGQKSEVGGNRLETLALITNGSGELKLVLASKG